MLINTVHKEHWPIAALCRQAMGMARCLSSDRALVGRMVGEDVRLVASAIKDTQSGITT